MTPRAAGILLALASAVLFGLVNVAAKPADVHPLLLSGASYLLAGVLLAPTLRGVRMPAGDRWKVLVVALVGGAVAPVLLFFGLQRAAASDASLVLTLEMVGTALLARLLLGERVGRWGAAGLALLLAAVALVAVASGGEGGRSSWLGLALVALAALGWAVDNTVSARLVKDLAPHRLVALKGLVGGAATLLVLLALGGASVPSPGDALRIAYVGALGVGASIVLFYGALQRAGASVTVGVFLPASALTGVLAAALLLREALGPLVLLAAALAAGGLALVARKPI